MALCGVAPASGADSMLLAGAEWTADSSYLYGGAVIPVPGSRLGSGLVQRYWIDRLTYQYEKDGRDIKALAPGFEASLGLQGSDQHGWWGAYGGLCFRDTHLSPDDSDARARGRQLRPKGQAEGSLDVAALRFHAIASYIFGLRSYWVRGGVQVKLGPTLRTGPEITVQGDPDYSARMVGWLISGIPLSATANLGLSAGVGSVADEPWHPYFGLSVSVLF